MKRFALRLSLVLLLSACANLGVAEMRVVRDIAYKTAGDDYERVRCKLDLYLPEGEAFPVVVWFHGGGLTAGEKTGDTEQRLAKWLVEHGIGCANVGYRLSPKAKFPAYVEDTAAAAAWVKKNIEKYGGDAEKLFVSGHSAGGYLTAIIGVDPQYLAVHDMTPDDLRGLMPISGQMSTHTTIQGERGEVSETRVIDAAAPLFHVKNLGPPVLVIAGSEDSPDREEVNRDYAQALEDAGHEEVTLLVVEGRDHGTIIARVDEPDDAVGEAMLKFIRAHSADQLERVEIGDMIPVHQCGELLLAGQPEPADLELLKSRGVKTIISVRYPQEVDWDEAAAAQKYDMTFIQVPFEGAGELTDDVFGKVLTVLRDKQSGPTVFHCGSANRVGAIWYVHRVLDEGVAPEVAEAEAKRVGLRNPEYLEKAREYVEKHSAAPATPASANR